MDVGSLACMHAGCTQQLRVNLDQGAASALREKTCQVLQVAWVSHDLKYRQPNGAVIHAIIRACNHQPGPWHALKQPSP